MTRQKSSEYVKLKKPLKRRKKRRKLKPGVKRFIIRFLVAVLIALAIAFLYRPVSEQINHYFEKPVPPPDTIRVEEIPMPKDTGVVRVVKYKDLNAAHLEVAQRNGIQPFTSNQAFLDNIGRMMALGKLVKIEDNEYYVIKELTHSHPYLTPKAASLLNEIGRRYSERLAQNGLGKSYFQVSSLLRTNESQKRLSRSNRNASSSSSHLYGTTFDITYMKVKKIPHPLVSAEVVDGPAMKILSDVLGELRKEGRCLVVTERNEACFHITAK